MDVHIYQTVPFRVTNAKDLVHKIKTEGTMIESFPPTLKSLPVQGMYFILGGRKSIDKVLNATPEVNFLGNKLIALMTRYSTLTKHYTVLAISPSENYSSLKLYNKSGWSTLYGPGQQRGFGETNQIRFGDLANRMWAIDAKVLGGVMDYATGAMK